jgi:hypothetical protein
MLGYQTSAKGYYKSDLRSSKEADWLLKYIVWSDKKEFNML